MILGLWLETTALLRVNVKVFDDMIFSNSFPSWCRCIKILGEIGQSGALLAEVAYSTAVLLTSCDGYIISAVLRICNVRFPCQVLRPGLLHSDYLSNCTDAARKVLGTEMLTTANLTTSAVLIRRTNVLAI